MTSDENREKEWWDRWWTEDWSWDGLAEKEWKDGKTLQDYWRAEEDDLIQGPDGKLFTRAHTPLEWPEGADSFGAQAPKNQWSEDALQALANELTARLETHRGTDNPARFDGTVLPIVPSMPKASKDEGAPPDQQPASLHAVQAWLQPVFLWSCEVFAEVSFDHAAFSGTASFRSTTFRRSASFSAATFSGQSWFENACFDGDAYFRETRFRREVWFRMASFNGHAWFMDASFGGDAEFGSFFLPSLPEGKRLSFQRATFEKMARFDIGQLSNYARYSRRAFHGTSFQGNLYTESDSGDVPLSVGAFDGAQISALIFLDPSQTSATGRPVPEMYLEQIKSADSMADERLRTQNLRSIAEGARVLQIAMDKGRNREAEQLFHRVEMIARQELRDAPWAPWPWADRFPWDGDMQSRLTWLYGSTSNFGASILRPMRCLLLAWVVCTAIFFMGHIPSRAATCDSLMPLRCDVTAIGTDVTAAASLSFKNISRPFFVWSQSKSAAPPFEQRLLFAKNGDIGLGGFLVRTISTLQSFFSAVMLFLTILAARRYYQLG